jgi:tetratricopeptide (TPR) repeat protein
MQRLNLLNHNTTTWHHCRCLSALLLALMLGTLFGFWAPPAHAQGQRDDWIEQPTDNFIILYTDDHTETVTTYTGFADGVYEEMATLFDHRTATPITLRLYPTFEDYYEVNPLARNMPGVVAHADFRRREVAVILPQTEQQTPDEVENNVRHELAHIIVADLSGNRMNTGFQEGIAQYVEHTSPRVVEQKIDQLDRARELDQLLPWSDLDDRNKVYSNPQISYPQTLSIISFLVERYGFDKLRDFLTVSARSSGYRSALERAYGISATDLEEAWRDWLPTYIEGGYLNKSLGSYDLAYPRQLLGVGRYGEAQAELERAVEWMQNNPEGDETTAAPEPELLTEAEALLEQSRQGLRAETLANEARSALEQGQYELARQKIEAARSSYQALGDARQQQVLDTYAERVERGTRAAALLEQAQQQKDALRLLEAAATAEAAATEFAAIGDSAGLERALELRQSLETRQRMAGIILVAVGIVGVLISTVSRFFGRREEVW